MSKRVLSQYLRTFKSEETTRFKDFLESPFFNITSRSRSISVYDYLTSHYAPDYIESDIDIEKIQSELGFTNVKNIFTSLIQSIELYMSHYNLEGRRSKNALNLLEELKSRGLMKLFSKKVDAYVNDPWEDEKYAHQKYDILYRVYKEYNTSYAVDRFSASEDSMLQYHHYQDLHYALIKIKSILSLYAEKGTIDKKLNEKKYIDVIHTALRNTDDNLILKIYALIYSHTEPSDKEESLSNFRAAKELYFHNLDEIPELDRLEMFTGLLNYGKAIVKTYGVEYNAELFSLYKQAYEKEVVFYEGLIHPSIYYAITQLASECGQIEWAKTFINKNKKNLHTSLSHSLPELCMAYVYSSSDRCEDAISIISQLEIKDIFYSLISKIIMIKSYYDLKEYYALDNYIKTYQNYIRRQKQLSEKAKIKYLRFSSLVLKLMKADSKKDIASLMKIISTEEDIIYRSWLSLKVSQL